MAFTYIIKVDTYIAESPVNGNIDSQLILPTIKRVQKNIILSILGTALYNDLLSEIDSDPDLSGNVPYQTLVNDYITPCMVEYINAELPPDLTFKFTNKSIVKKNSENSQPVDLTEMRNIIQRATYRAQLEGERLIRYLVTNANTLYPLYLNPGNTYDTVIPRATMFSTGMYLGNEKRKGIGYTRDPTGPDSWRF